MRLFRHLSAVLCEARTPVTIEGPLHAFLLVLVCAAPVDNACQIIRNCPAISERMRQSMMRRALNFMEEMLSTSRACPASAIGADICSRFGMWNSCPKFVTTFQLHLYRKMDTYTQL
jgi:hypothetical protein